MKILGAVFIVVSSLCLGLYFSQRLRKRYENLEKCIAAMEYLKTHICVMDVNMKKALNDTENAYGVCGIFNTAADNMQKDGLKTAWKQSVLMHKANACFTERDAQILISAGDRLGNTDADNQRKNIEAVSELMRAQAEEAKSEYEKKGRLYRNCSLMCGLMMSILLF